VLEVGVGNGTHAEMLSKNCKSFTGIDLTEFASKATKKRFKVKKLPGAILKMDAEKMSFSNNKFDFIWSWGVIHHSSNTKEILKEIHRVLKPDGEAIIMVYHKSFWYYYIVNGLFRGVFLGKLFKLGSIHKVVQYYTDGAIARYYTENEWKDLAAGLFKIKKFSVYGQKLEILPIPYSKFKIFLANCIPSSITRQFLNKWKFGSMLVIHMTK
jgi:ubiquinone/menaquinone biosynthesis C-methylase UbiE